MAAMLLEPAGGATAPLAEVWTCPTSLCAMKQIVHLFSRARKSDWNSGMNSGIL
jgi:hypothetical protein